MILMARHLTCHMKVSDNCVSACDLLELFLLGKKFTLFRRNLTSRIDRAWLSEQIFFLLLM